MSSSVYIQIHNRLGQNIEDGEWKVGDKISAERELASDFDVSRMTLRQAIQVLVDEGILGRRVDSGTFVANRKIQEKMSGITSSAELIHATGKKTANKTISYHLTVLSQTEVEKLKLTPDEQILRVERVRYGNDVPICYEIATVPASLVQRFGKEEITASFYRTLEKRANLYPGHATQYISATKATEKIANYLQIKRGDAFLRMTQLSYLQNGRPFEYVHIQYVGPWFGFVFEK